METQQGSEQTIVAEQELSGADSALPQNNEAAGQEETAENKGLTIEDLAKRFSSEAAEAKKPKQAPPKAQEAQSDTEDTAGSEDQNAPNETQAQDGSTEAQPEDDLSQFSESVRKKIGKYSFKLKQAEHELTQVKAKAQEAEQLRAHLATMQAELARVSAQQQQAASGAEPGDVDKAADEATLSRIEGSASEAIRFYERNRRLIDRAALQGEESVQIGEKTYSISDLENGYDYAKRLKEERIPERRKTVQAQQAVKQQSLTFAQQAVPAMFQPGTPESNLAVGYLNSNPKLRDFEDSPRLLALAIRGYQALEKEAAAAGKGKTDGAPQKAKPVEKAPNLEGGGLAPTRASRDNEGTAAKRQASEALNRLRSSGSQSDLAAFFKKASR